MTSTNPSRAVIVTGGQGLIGNAIARALAPAFRTMTAGRNASCDMQVDLMLQMPKFSAAANGYWVHAAGITDEECRNDPAAALQRAALTTPKIVEAAVNAGIEKFVYISSAHVYGPFEGTINENSAVNPLTLYAQCHFLAEQAFRQCAIRHGKPALVLRPCAVYGMPALIDAFQRWSLIPYEFPRNAVELQKIEIRSSGLQSRNFVSNRWIAELVRKFLQSQQQNKLHVLNPIGADDITVREFALRCRGTYQELTGKHCEVSWHGAEQPAPSSAFQYRSIHQGAVAPTSDLDAYLHDILTTLEQHAYAN
jgi:UDP-glucose 4-epimerase